MSSDLQELYNMDEDEWREKNIKLLDEGRLSEIDAINIRVCLIEMGISEDRAFKSYLENILIHLLYINFSKKLDPINHWKAEVDGFRSRLNDFFKMKNYVRKFYEFLPDAYKIARKKVLVKFQNADIPKECPYNYSDVSSEDYYGG